jgi:CubicO group peptidase (beta-lactamase class C family)
VWVEFLLALIVEGYREFLEWWQTRSFFRPRGRVFDEETDESLARLRPASSIGAEPLERQVDRILDRHGRKHTGIALGVYRHGEELTFVRGQARVDRLAPPTAETIFEIGSITKVFTATVLADMVEDGLVQLSDPVQRYLPDDVVLPVRGRPITLADLATQTSGLPRLPPGIVLQSLRLRQNPYAHFTVADLERAIVTVRLKGEPGEKLRYSNFGFGLARARARSPHWTELRTTGARACLRAPRSHRHANGNSRI